jgi:hypothetical protein
MGGPRANLGMTEREKFLAIQPVAILLRKNLVFNLNPERA